MRLAALKKIPDPKQKLRELKMYIPDDIVAHCEQVHSIMIAIKPQVYKTCFTKYTKEEIKGYFRKLRREEEAKHKDDTAKKEKQMIEKMKKKIKIENLAIEPTPRQQVISNGRLRGREVPDIQ